VRPVIFSQAARQEVIEAQDWYLRESLSLARRFLAAFNAVVEQIVANPRQFPVVSKNIRRALLRRFPYALLFVIESDDSVMILACFHSSRDPTHWQRRM